MFSMSQAKDSLSEKGFMPQLLKILQDIVPLIIMIKFMEALSIHGPLVMNLCIDKMVDFLCFDLEREMCEEGYYIGVHLAHLRS